ncbi:hypothetical protein ABLN87_22090 [Ruegeria sp. SCPT10]|uniref:hypothetical protein n=1 Tax=Ruegeria sp. SCP10 TaxID=3141377 RepID=UPI00333CB1B5
MVKVNCTPSCFRASGTQSNSEYTESLRGGKLESQTAGSKRAHRRHNGCASKVSDAFRNAISKLNPFRSYQQSTPTLSQHNSQTSSRPRSSVEQSNPDQNLEGISTIGTEAERNSNNSETQSLYFDASQFLNPPKTSEIIADITTNGLFQALEKISEKIPGPYKADDIFTAVSSSNDFSSDRVVGTEFGVAKLRREIEHSSPFRLQQSNNSETVYLKLSHLAKEIVADRYQEKYGANIFFLDGNNLDIRNSPSVCAKVADIAQKEGEIGIIVHNELHSTPISISSQSDGSLKLEIFDSMGNPNLKVEAIAEELSKRYNISVIALPWPRQADWHSCHVDAIHILKEKMNYEKSKIEKTEMSASNGEPQISVGMLKGAQRSDFITRYLDGGDHEYKPRRTIEEHRSDFSVRGKRVSTLEFRDPRALLKQSDPVYVDGSRFDLVVPKDSTNLPFLEKTEQVDLNIFLQAKAFQYAHIAADFLSTLPTDTDEANRIVQVMKGTRNIC